MSFKPRMISTVNGIAPLTGVNSLPFDHMIIDHWRVEARAGATGQYCSPDPRFVVLFDKANISLSEGAQEKPQICTVCYDPGGKPLCGRIEAGGYLEHIDIHISARHLQRVVGGSTALKNPLFLSSSPELYRLGALIADECQHPQRPGGYTESLTMGLIHEVFHIARGLNDTHTSPAWLDHVIQHAVNNLHRPLRVDDLAASAHMSRSGFSRRFKEATGLSPHQWVMRARIEQAQHLLCQGLPLAHVAHDTGFSDQAHLSRCFRNAVGLTPAQWARRYVPSKP